MIRWVKGDIFESQCEVITNPCNCIGVDGKGLSLEFRKRYPAVAKRYRSACAEGYIVPGRPLLTMGDERPVLHFPTKRHWRERSRLDDIEDGLVSLAEGYLLTGQPKSLALPALGCGLGGLDWADVKPLIRKHLGPLDMDVEVYEPEGT